MKKNNGSPWQIIKDAFSLLIKNDPLRMGGATAFFTTFALPPILIILTFVLGLISDKIYIAAQLKERIADLLDQKSANQIILILQGIQNVTAKPLTTAFGILFLLFIATTLFNVIQHSINQIWSVRTVKKRGIKYALGLRLRSLVVIIIAGLLFLGGLIFEGGQAIVGEKTGELFPSAQILINILMNFGSSFVIVTIWFAILFRFLPDGKSTFKILLIGSAITSFLFNIGKLIFRISLGSSNLNSIYGPSGSIVLLLLFVFYASLILYFGAAVIKVLSGDNEKTKLKIKYLSYSLK